MHIRLGIVMGVVVLFIYYLYNYYWGFMYHMTVAVFFFCLIILESVCLH